MWLPPGRSSLMGWFPFKKTEDRRRNTACSIWITLNCPESIEGNQAWTPEVASHIWEEAEWTGRRTPMPPDRGSPACTGGWLRAHQPLGSLPMLKEIFAVDRCGLWVCPLLPHRAALHLLPNVAQRKHLSSRLRTPHSSFIPGDQTETGWPST